jgi:hypothetical protein
MKQTVRWILVSVVACAICSLVTYRIAYHRGYEGGYKNATVDEIGRGRLAQSVAFLAALQKLRAGDVPLATRQMEQSCFASAHIFYKDPTPAGEVSQWGRAQGLATYPDAATTKAIAQELMKYRAAYRTNSADWDDLERKLVVELAKLK